MDWAVFHCIRGRPICITLQSEGFDSLVIIFYSLFWSTFLTRYKYRQGWDTQVLYKINIYVATFACGLHSITSCSLGQSIKGSVCTENIKTSTNMDANSFVRVKAWLLPSIMHVWMPASLCRMSGARYFKDISLMRLWLMGENLGPGHDVIMSQCNPLALSPISRRLRVSGTGREDL